MIYEYFFSYGGPELVMLFTIFIVTPIYFRLFLRKASSRTRLYAVGGLWIAALITVYWDVIYIGFKARELCRKHTGVIAYSSSNDRSLIGRFDLEEIGEFGIDFIEYASPSGFNKYRQFIEGGIKLEERIDAFTSNLEYTIVREELTVAIARSVEQIRNRHSNETLAEMSTYFFYPGWIDRRLIGATGLAWSPPYCDGPWPPSVASSTLRKADLVRAVKSNG